LKITTSDKLCRRRVAETGATKVDYQKDIFIEQWPIVLCGDMVDIGELLEVGCPLAFTQRL
jgi:hypothetical protein